MPRIETAKILILSTNGFEQSELLEPLRQLRERGADVKVASPESGEIKGWDSGDWGESVPVDLGLDQVDVGEFDALVLPGGQINPDLLRVNDDALRIVHAFFEAGKIVAAICHAPWLLVETGDVRGRTVTSYPSIRTDVRNAGGDWRDEPVVVDKGLITSRKPDDLPAFIAKIIEEIEEGKHQRAA